MINLDNTGLALAQAGFCCSAHANLDVALTMRLSCYPPAPTPNPLSRA